MTRLSHTSKELDMRPTFLTLTLAGLTCLPADSTRAETRPKPVAEIVTFRLQDHADPAEFAKAADGMTPLLADTGAVLTRTLSRDANGLWTDYILWTSMAAAEAAASELPSRPEAAPFMSMIDPATVSMRHATVLFQQEG